MFSQARMRQHHTHAPAPDRSGLTDTHSRGRSNIECYHEVPTGMRISTGSRMVREDVARDADLRGSPENRTGRGPSRITRESHGTRIFADHQSRTGSGSSRITRESHGNADLRESLGCRTGGASGSACGSANSGGTPQCSEDDVGVELGGIEAPPTKDPRSKKLRSASRRKDPRESASRRKDPRESASRQKDPRPREIRVQV
jgi:hypothetical protein